MYTASSGLPNSPSQPPRSHSIKHKNNKRKALNQLVVQGNRLGAKSNKSGSAPKGVAVNSSCQVKHWQDRILPKLNLTLTQQLSLKLDREPTSSELKLAKKVVIFFKELEPESGLNGAMELMEVHQNRDVKTLAFNTSLFASRIPEDSRVIDTLLGENVLENVPDFFNGVLRTISVKLKTDMTKQHHHTTVHAHLMGKYAEDCLAGITGNRYLRPLAHIMGAAHDVVQKSGPKNNEFESAYFVMHEFSKNYEYESLSSEHKGAIVRLVYHTICSFTTLDFSKLETFGEGIVKSRSTQEEGRPRLLETLGPKVAHNDLFSKIDFLGQPKKFEKLVPNHKMTEVDCKAAVLICQMFQVRAEIPALKSVVQPILDSLSDRVKGQDLKDHFLSLIDSEVSEPYGFWRPGMSPGDNMAVQLGIGSESSLHDWLISKCEEPNFLNKTYTLIQAMETEGFRNPSLSFLERQLS